MDAALTESDSLEGLSISFRLPFRRTLATSLFSALVLALAVPGPWLLRSLIVAAAALVAGVLQWRGLRRAPTLLAFTPANESPSVGP